MATYFSFGGGVQSTAALVLVAQGKISADAFLFANVGEDSEHPATLTYLREVAMPYAEAHGIPLIERYKVRRDGTQETIYGKLMRPGSRSVDIPVRMSNGAPGRRSCTQDFKIKVTASYAWSQGARKANPATMQLGISLDELTRMRNESDISYIKLAYPLVDLGLTRQDCQNIISDAGLPVPPKSSCWFCPFHRLSTWKRMRDHEPELFDRAVALEQHLNETRQRIGKDAIWLTSAGKPLDRAVSDIPQLELFAEEQEYSCGPFVCRVAG